MKQEAVVIVSARSLGQRAALTKTKDWRGSTGRQNIVSQVRQDAVARHLRGGGGRGEREASRAEGRKEEREV